MRLEKHGKNKILKSEHFQKNCNLVLFCALVIAFFVSFVLGRYNVPLLDVFKILLDRILKAVAALLNKLSINVSLGITKTWTDTMEKAVINVRLPRILLSCIVGCSLSCAGTSYQNVFHNPMASPDILGASSGACFGAALAILLGASKAMVTVSAFFCSLVTVILVYVLGLRGRGSQVANILLAGIIVGSLFSAGTSYIKLVADPSDQLPEITYWLMGSLSGAKMSDVLFVIIPVAISVIPLILMRWRMNLLTLSEEEAGSMGVNSKRLRFAVIMCATCLTASSVAVSGMIGWVGLVIPHICRKLVGNDNRYLLPSSMIFGALFLLVVDNFSRNLIETEIPIGILTAFIGAPFFIYLMIRREKIL